MPLSKNHAARLKRVQARLDRSLDALMQANGELWPTELRPYGERMQEAVNVLQSLTKDIDSHLTLPVTPDAVEAVTDPDQEDIEDVEGVEQPQASGRRRRAAA